MKPEKIRRSQAQEARSAQLVGGVRQPASGAFHAAPNDVKSDRFLIENKRTDGVKSITLKSADLRKVELNGLRMGKLPVLSFEVDGKDWYAVPDWAWQEMIAE